MNMRIISLIFLMSSIILSVSASKIKYYDKNDKIEYDSIPYMVNAPTFEKSYQELLEMFDGKIPYSLKRAEFLVENAFYDNTMNYDKFCHDIDSVVNVLNRFIDVNNFRRYKTAPNFAIFEYFTKPSIMNGNRKFSYDFEDPTGKKDFSIFFVSRLLKTHKGQCTSMPLLYKILCDELGGHSALAFGPMHLYIKHIGEDGRWVNVELTHGGFFRDVWMMEAMNISTEAIRNGIFMCALSKKETIGFMLMQLARAYQRKYDSYDFFVERCINSVLAQLPSFSDALVLKLNLYQDQGNKFKAKYGDGYRPYLHKHHQEYMKVVSALDSLGYSQPTIEEYNAQIAKGIEFTKKETL